MCTTTSSSAEKPFKSDPIKNWRKRETPISVMQIPLHPLSSPAELAYPRTLILGLWRIAASSRMTNCTSRSSKTSPQTRKYPCISQPQSPSSPSLRCSGGLSSESPPPPTPSSPPPSSPGGHTDSVINTNNNTDSLGPPSDHHLCSCKSQLNTLSSSSSSSSLPQRRIEFRKVGSWTFLVVIAYLLLVVPGSEGCGPGRGAGRRRAPRKLTPLVYKQHVPNVPENTLSASGLTEGKISRDHHRFKNLVPNYNQDIIFRDDEGSGADRLMTQRCKEKLNTLAISVMNQWPGVKLRVIEGWDEENLHAPHSLHYEGRAVDITTSDKDRSKYGMLARLAVEAGFDWVYYESRAHIHCSVKSDSTQTGRTGGCFSGNSTVETPTGPVKISEISAGDQILTLDSEGNEVFSDVLLFLDRNATERREFFEIQTASGSSITLTPSHLLYTVQPESLSPHEKFLFSPNTFVVGKETGKLFLDTAVISFAKNVQIGDWVLVKRTGGGFGGLVDNGIEELDESVTYDIERVVGMEVRLETGVYAPLTSTGNLIVDGVLASCYAVIDDQDLAHYAFLPVRLSHNLVKGVSHLWRRLSGFISLKSHVEKSSSLKGVPRRSSVETRRREDGQGVHWYANYLYSLTKHLLPSHLMYDA